MTATMLLIRGAFADGSAWNKVIAPLGCEGVAARAVANPLRRLSADRDCDAHIAAQMPGDVVLVRHSYGGAAVTHADSCAPNVKALVFVGAFGLAHYESAQTSGGGYSGLKLSATLQPWTYPGSDPPEFTIRTDNYRRIFAADVTNGEAAFGVATQRPGAAVALVEPLAIESTWCHVPSRSVYGTKDHSINPVYLRETAKKINAFARKLAGDSHSIAISRADEVAALIVDTVRAVS